MRSDLQKETARLNGAKSRGPNTAAGKANSSRNHTTHGLYSKRVLSKRVLSKTILIEGEDPAKFAALLNAIRAALQPRNAVEESLVEDLVTCRWRQRRLLAMETACLSDEIRRQDPVTAAAPHVTRAVTALNTLTTENRALELINRNELRLDRQFNRTLHRLYAIRDREKQPKIDFEDSNPGTN